MIAAEVVADSVTPDGARLTTLTLTYPRFIHAEFLTHRTFSRNASSSRAIPVKRMVRGVLERMVTPHHIGRAQKGMQADQELEGWRREAALLVWRATGLAAAAGAWAMGRLGVHKQVANRMLEPWSPITVVCSSTCFDNFFALRCHPMAQPEIRLLAEAMRVAVKGSLPSLVRWGHWHLPFITDKEAALDVEDRLKVSVARCARVSYLTHEGGSSSLDRDIALYDRLMEATPRHASPAEHQALADPVLARTDKIANFTGWRQYRSVLAAQDAPPKP